MALVQFRPGTRQNWTDFSLLLNWTGTSWSGSGLSLLFFFLIILLKNWREFWPLDWFITEMNQNQDRRTLQFGLWFFGTRGHPYTHSFFYVHVIITLFFKLFWVINFWSKQQWCTWKTIDSPCWTTWGREKLGFP